jgi:hypothetical protein
MEPAPPADNFTTVHRVPLLPDCNGGCDCDCCLGFGLTVDGGFDERRCAKGFWLSLILGSVVAVLVAV